jgi:hypothetical protein
MHQAGLWPHLAHTGRTEALYSRHCPLRETGCVLGATSLNYFRVLRFRQTLSFVTKLSRNAPET